MGFLELARVFLKHTISVFVFLKLARFEFARFIHILLLEPLGELIGDVWVLIGGLTYLCSIVGELLVCLTFVGESIDASIVLSVYSNFNQSKLLLTFYAVHYFVVALIQQIFLPLLKLRLSVFNLRNSLKILSKCARVLFSLVINYSPTQALSFLSLSLLCWLINLHFFYSLYLLCRLPFVGHCCRWGKHNLACVCVQI